MILQLRIFGDIRALKGVGMSCLEFRVVAARGFGFRVEVSGSWLHRV